MICGPKSRCRPWLAATAVALSWALGFSSSASCSEITDTAAMDLAKAAIRRTLGGDERTFVAITRDPGLENAFARCFSRPLEAAPFLFRASNQGEEARGPVTTAHLSVEGPIEFIIAVSGTGEVFEIKGARRSERQLGQLLERYRLDLRSVVGTRQFLQFYLAVNPQNRIPRVVESASGVRDLAKGTFIARFGDEKGVSAFETWWQRHLQEVRTLDFKAQIAQDDASGFSATFYALSDIGLGYPDKEPAVLRVSLKISAKGRVTGPHFEPMWH